MKKTLIKSVSYCLIAVAFAWIAQCAVAEDAMSTEKGKIYMLTVWTGTSRNSTYTVPKNKDHTQNKEFHEAVESSRKLFESNLNEMGLDVSNKNLIAENISLVGEDTSPQKIIDAIYELSQKAGEEDALFVYIQSHGAAIEPPLNYKEEHDTSFDNGPLGQGWEREHYILPLIETPVADPKKDGVLRSNLLYYMRSKKHRLNVLITDSCSSVDVNLKIRRTTPVFMGQEPTSAPAPCDPATYAFRYLLTHATGTISWNSACPCFCYAVKANEEKEYIIFDDQGKYCLKTQDLVRNEPKYDNTQSASKTFELSLASNDTGTVFNIAFIKAATRTIKHPENGYTFEDFFEDLGNDYDAMYKNYLEAMPEIDLGVEQAITTLTSFNVEDDHTGNPMNDQKAVAKTNNRVKKVYVHKNTNSGSGKTKSSSLDLSFSKN